MSTPYPRCERLRYEERFRAVSNMTSATSQSGDPDAILEATLEQVIVYCVVSFGDIIVVVIMKYKVVKFDS